MKKKFKLLLLFIFTALITSGCTINYNLTIKDDRSIFEEVVATESNSILKTTYGDYKKEINNQEEFYNNHDLYSSYHSKKIYKSDYSGLKLYRDFEYGQFSNSPTYASLFQKYTFVDNEDGYTFRLSYPIKENLYPDTNDSEISVDSAYINIKSYLKVIDSNSDSYDEKTKTYTWVLDDDFFNDYEGLYIKLSKEKDYQVILTDFFRAHSVTIITIISILFILLIGFIYIYSKHKKGMKV